MTEHAKWTAGSRFPLSIFTALFVNPSAVVFGTLAMLPLAIIATVAVRPTAIVVVFRATAMTAFVLPRIGHG